MEDWELEDKWFLEISGTRGLNPTNFPVASVTHAIVGVYFHSRYERLTHSWIYGKTLHSPYFWDEKEDGMIGRQD